MFWHVIKRAEEDDGTWKTKETLANKSRHVISFYLRVECTLIESSSFITSLCHIYNKHVLVFWLNTKLCKKTMNCQIVVWIIARLYWVLPETNTVSQSFLMHENHRWFFYAVHPVLGINLSTITLFLAKIKVWMYSNESIFLCRPEKSKNLVHFRESGLLYTNNIDTSSIQYRNYIFHLFEGE